MDDSGPGANIVLYFVLLLVDVFFYGFGSALGALNRKEVERRVEEKDKKSVRLNSILGNPTEYENTVELATTLVNVIMGAVHLALLLRLVNMGLQVVAENRLQLQGIPAGAIMAVAAVLSTLLLQYITLTLGVLLPKKVAARIPDKWAYVCIGPVYFITRLLSPFMGLVTLTTKGILRIFGAGEKKGEADVTEEEIIDRKSVV